MIDFVFLAYLFLFSNIGPKTKGPMLPLENEKLKKPLFLSEECKKVSIIEWKTNNIELPQTENSIKVINKVCNDAIKYFYVFTSQKNKVKLDLTISLLPESSNYRDLNDSDFRFWFRTKNYNNGVVIPIFGYFQRNANHIYLTNQVFTKKDKIFVESLNFKKVLGHEIFHALSYKTGLFNKHIGNKDEIDEKLAQKFSIYFK